MSEHPESDLALLARIKARDGDALMLLYQRYRLRIFSLTLRILKDRPQAEEVLQDVFQRLWDRPEMYDLERGQLLSWLLTIARNLSLDVKRKESRRANYYVIPHEREEREAMADAADAVEAETVLSLRKLLRHLPAEQREALELAYFEGKTHTELAEELGESLGTIKTRIRLGMQKLKQALHAGLLSLL